MPITFVRYPPVAVGHGSINQITLSFTCHQNTGFCWDTGGSVIDATRFKIVARISTVKYVGVVYSRSICCRRSTFIHVPSTLMLLYLGRDFINKIDPLFDNEQASDSLSSPGYHTKTICDRLTTEGALSMTHFNREAMVNTQEAPRKILIP